MTIGQLIKTRLFWVFIILMVCAGSSELAMAQWASAFAESALNVSQRAGENLQAGVLAGIGLPIILVICVLIVRKRYKEK